MFDRESITKNARASFYACILEDLKKVAYDCGWALGIHGSLLNDMDIMAMPWTENALQADDFITELNRRCFEDGPFDVICSKHEKPHNRIVYSIPIWGDYYLDISIIN